MVFYIIAFAESNAKNNNEGQAAQRVRQVFPVQPGRADFNKLCDLKINKAQFKVGSLDQLMGLNETAAKLDVQLDQVCKKIERVALDSGEGGQIRT
jgi:hypothetical protein